MDTIHFVERVRPTATQSRECLIEHVRGSAAGDKFIGCGGKNVLNERLKRNQAGVGLYLRSRKTLSVHCGKNPGCLLPGLPRSRVLHLRERLAEVLGHNRTVR